MQGYEKLILPAIGVGAIILMALLFGGPLKKLFKALINSATGIGILLLLNLLEGVTGVSIALNIPTAVTAGVLGMPGITAMLLIKLFFKI